MAYVVQNNEDLGQKISEAGDKLIVIDFYANWCGPCKIIAPKLDELSNRYNEKVMVLKVNVDDNEDIALEYNVTSMPTFVFIKNNEVIDFFVGGNSEKLVDNVEKHVNIERAVSQATISVGGAEGLNIPFEDTASLDMSEYQEAD